MTPAQNTAAYIKGFEDGERATKAKMLRELESQEPVVIDADKEFWFNVCEDLDGAKKEKSPTFGMTLSERIAHVGGRENTAGYIEFGSVMAVNALIHHALRDIQQPKRTWVGLTDEDCKGMSAGDRVVAMWADRTIKEKNNA
jgi:hypothetical protein